MFVWALVMISSLQNVNYTAISAAICVLTREFTSNNDHFFWLIKTLFYHWQNLKNFMTLSVGWQEWHTACKKNQVLVAQLRYDWRFAHHWSSGWCFHHLPQLNPMVWYSGTGLLRLYWKDSHCCYCCCCCLCFYWYPISFP